MFPMTIRIKGLHLMTVKKKKRLQNVLVFHFLHKKFTRGIYHMKSNFTWEQPHLNVELEQETRDRQSGAHSHAAPIQIAL